MTPMTLPISLGLVMALLAGEAGWCLAQEAGPAPQPSLHGPQSGADPPLEQKPKGTQEPGDGQAPKTDKEIDDQPETADRASQIKAGMVLNFIRYTEWPGSAFDSADSPVVITVLGDAEICSALDQTLKGQTVHDRPAEVRHLRYPVPLAGESTVSDDRLREFAGQLRASHVLFICNSERERLDKVLQSVEDSEVLTVSDIDAFAGHGGMLGLVIRRDRVAFDANPDEIQESHLKVSSQLLRLAKSVKTRSQ